jgi:hypothetical protein
LTRYICISKKAKIMKNELIYPELGETTTAKIEYTTAHNNKLYVTTDLCFSGKGIYLRGDGSTHARGKKTYFMTETAFKRVSKGYSTAYIALL